MKILGVRIDDHSKDEIKNEVIKALDHTAGQKFVTTLNPEILLRAHRDSDYRMILNRAELNVCDGFGLQLVSHLRGKKIKNRFAGADLADFLLEIASRKNYRVAVIVSENSLSSPFEIMKKTKEIYPNLEIESLSINSSQNFFENGIIKAAEIVFVSFGAPEQEKFIAENREKFAQAKILVGVGGTFDFFTGKIRRAPKSWRASGFEWLWRLMQEPKRWRRIFKAVIVFPILAIWE